MNIFLKIILLLIVSTIIGVILHYASEKNVPLTYFNKDQRLAQKVDKIKNVQENEMKKEVIESKKIEEKVQFSSFIPLEAYLSEKSKYLIIDARPTVFYKAGHIPGAHSLSRKNFEKDYFNISSIISKEYLTKDILVYCSSSSCPDAEKVAKAFIKLGYKRVSVLYDGLRAWKNANLEIERK